MGRGCTVSVVKDHDRERMKAKGRATSVGKGKRDIGKVVP